MADDITQLKREVMRKCFEFLNNYMLESKNNKNKKLIAQSLLKKQGYKFSKSRPHLKIRFEIFKRDDFKCVYCGRSSQEVVLEVDHINPVSSGGDASYDNLATACKECNIGKKDFLLNERQEEKFRTANKEKTSGISEG